MALTFAIIAATPLQRSLPEQHPHRRPQKSAETARIYDHNYHALNYLLRRSPDNDMPIAKRHPCDRRRVSVGAHALFGRA